MSEQRTTPIGRPDETTTTATATTTKGQRP